VQALRARGCRHLLVYSGYTLRVLRRCAAREPEVGAVLDAIDLLIDGPFVAARANGAAPWRGSRSQRLHRFPARGSAGGVSGGVSGVV
jgi:anaerobic ribonucleoside-triphosphate reductase activating protein